LLLEATQSIEAKGCFDLNRGNGVIVGEITIRSNREERIDIQTFKQTR
jgi:hypothetical protein